MMKFYIEILLLPCEDINLGFLWQKVYQQVHLALAENKVAENKSAIGVSFPEYGAKNFPLGSKLRLFAVEKDQLDRMDIHKWLYRLADYTHIKSIKEVPATVSQYAFFKRRQFKTNPLKEARRRAKWKNESLEEALKHFENYRPAQAECKLPYINMTSLSMTNEGSRYFKLFIEREISNSPQQGGFNCYGLSKTTTVPWFAC